MSNFEEDNISRLKFIGKIKKGDKINIKDLFVQPNNIITKINRSFVNVDNRNNTLSFILETIKKSFEELHEHLNKSKDNIFDLNISSNIIVDLENSKTGLINLKDTYNDDLMFCCKIDTIVQDIDARLNEINTKFSFRKDKPKSSPITILNKTPPQIITNLEPLSLPSSIDSNESCSSVIETIVNIKKK